MYGQGMKATTVIPAIITQLRGGYMKLREYNTIRDFIYIKNVVNAFKAALYADCESRIYNVAAGVAYSIKDLIKIIARIMGKEKLVIHPNSVEGTPATLKLSCNRIEKELG